MRITNQMIVNNAIQNMADSQERISKLQTKVSSQKLFQNASDDPARASSSLSLRSQLRTIDSYTDTIANTQNWMTANDNALNQLEEISVRASNLILAGLNDNLTPELLAKSQGIEMQSLIDRAVEIGNTNLNGQYIFSGYQVNNKAFSLTNAPATVPDYQGNPITLRELNYLGDQGTMQRNLGPDQSVSMNVRGDQAIQGFIDKLILAGNAILQNKIHNTNDPLTDPYTLQTALSGVKSTAETLSQYRTMNGAVLRQVDSSSSFLETVKIETLGLLSQKEDTNLAEGIALLTNQQTTYQAVLEVSRRAISTLSLFEYMQ